MKTIFALFFSTFLLTGTVMANPNKTIFGYIEKATITSKNITLKAKLDTGAKTASLNAIDINEIEIDGEPYIRFKLPSKKGPIIFQKKFLGHVKIKVRTGESKFRSLKTGSVKRPVVLMDIMLGGKKRAVKVNLTDRKNFNYPLLLGRDAINQFNGIVDPSRRFITTKDVTGKHEQK